MRVHNMMSTTHHLAGRPGSASKRCKYPMPPAAITEDEFVEFLSGLELGATILADDDVFDEAVAMARFFGLIVQEEHDQVEEEHDQVEGVPESVPVPDLAAAVRDPRVLRQLEAFAGRLQRTPVPVAVPAPGPARLTEEAFRDLLSMTLIGRALVADPVAFAAAVQAARERGDLA